MRKEEKIVVGLSIGDLNGIGGELIIKTFEDQRMFDFCTPVVFANVKVFSFLKKHFSSDIKFNSVNNLSQIVHGKLNVINAWKERVDIQFGKEDFNVGKMAIRSFTSATKALKEKKVDVLLTAPINKHNIQSDEFNFPGHTDYLNQELEGNSLMFMVSDLLKIGLLTDHVAVKDVANNINSDLIKEKINTILQSLIKDFGVSKPKIAVLGINPHTGDNGVIGAEDDEILRPTLNEIRDEGKLVFGPYSADSFFGSKSHSNFDAIIASYHDQGLIPFKTLTFGKGVNYTAGLNEVRVSPDHGTAFEIAGQGKADIESFKEALFTGIQIFKNRATYEKISRKPLKKRNLKSEHKNKSA